MKKQLYILLTLVFVIMVASPVLAATPSLNNRPLKAILFFKDQCPDCRTLMEDLLPDSLSAVSDQSAVLAVNNSTSTGGNLYLELMIERNFPPSAQLPLMVTSEAVWSGFDQISQHLSDLRQSKSFFAQDVFPQNILQDLSDLKEARSSDNAIILIDGNYSRKGPGIFQEFRNNFLRDTTANSIAILVLSGMVLSLVTIILSLLKKPQDSFKPIPLLFPILYCAGFLIAFYLFTSNISQSELTCGPFGECNTVQQSEYSMLFGLIPVSFLGMLNYLICLMLWIGSRVLSTPLNLYSTLAVWGISVINVCFFIYLTFLEPFVIGATCSWCISSAIITTIATLVATKSAKTAIQALR